MAPIPPFDSQGVLPPFDGPDPTTQKRSPYLVTIGDVVAHFSTSPERRTILAGLLAYRAKLYSHGYVQGMQFLNGSFMENVEQTQGRAPGDIDVFSFLVKPAHLADPVAWVQQGLPVWTSEIINVAKNKADHKVDSYAITTDESFVLTISVTTYWYGLFSHQRDTFRWKGLLSVLLDPTADAAAAAQLKAT